MVDLEIPERARDTVLRAAWPINDPTPEQVSEALDIASRVIVAAELRRLARHNPQSGMGKLLLARADKLDPVPV